MRNLLPFLFILACPIMMIFMMRGMHSGGGTKATKDDTQFGRGHSAAQERQTPAERIAQLEHEVAQLRALQNGQAEHNRVRGS